MEHLEIRKKLLKQLTVGSVLTASIALMASHSIAATDSATKANRESASEERFDSFFGDAHDNMKKMRERAAQKRKEFAAGKSSGLKGDYKSSLNSGTLEDISTREDANSVFYDVKVKDLDSTSVNTNVKDGYITITGLTEKHSEYKDKNSYGEGMMKSGFERTFPLPENVDGNKMTMTAEKDKVILQFPKIKR